MGVSGYSDLRNHIGHKIVVVCYGVNGKAPHNVAVECEDCGEVLFDFDRPELKEHKAGKCPKCGKPLDYGVMEPTDNDQLFYAVECTNPKCNYSGKEYYYMTFIEHVKN